MNIRIYTVLLIVGIVVLNVCLPSKAAPQISPYPYAGQEIYSVLQPGLYSLVTKYNNTNKFSTSFEPLVFKRLYVWSNGKDTLDYNWFNDTIIIMDQCALEGTFNGRIWSTQDFVTKDNDDQFVHRSIYLLKQDSLYQLLLQWNKSEFKKKYAHPDDYIVHDGFYAFISRLILKENGIVSIDSMYIAKPNFY